VDAVGIGLEAALVGRRCVADNVWADGGEAGFEHPGGYAQYFLTEAANLQPLPADFPLALAVLIEPLAVTVRGMRRLRPAPPGPVLIFGDGPIGLLMLLQLKRAGRDDVVLAGGRPARLAVAARLGARVVDYHAVDLRSDDFLSSLGPRRLGTIIEAAGSAAALETSFDIMQTGGRILCLGDYGQSRAGFAWSHLLHREAELIFSNASAGAWPEATRLGTEGTLPLADLITHRLPAASFAEGMALVRDRQSGAIKVVLEWDRE
jgi:threonine dehydrogenase-like Zn-dependent dehydrogenase